MPNPSLYQIPASARTRQKRLGTYLTEAGLLSNDQIQVILNDQHATGMRFGDIAVARGWVKEQTIEWIMAKVVEPERRAIKSVMARQAAELAQKTEPMLPKDPPTQPPQPSRKKPENGSQSTKPFVRRDAPIAKSLPPVNSSDSEVNWVG